MIRKLLVFLFFLVFLAPPPVYGISAPKELLPYDGIVVTNPVAFSWVPGENNKAIYLNVATNPEFNPINVINWQDDGSHYYVEENPGKFKKGQTYWWRLVADDGAGGRVITPARFFPLEILVWIHTT